MQTKFKYIAIVAAAIIFITAGLGRAVLTEAAGEPAVAMIEQRSVYLQNCATCHGRDGKANTPKGREVGADDLTSSSVRSMSAARMASIIKNGKGDMPSFRKLTAAQISAVVKYVKSL